MSDVVRGSQQPRIYSAPPYASTSGGEAIELARLAGLELDPWQQFVLTQALGERADKQWAAFEVGCVVPRQNGKGSIEEARELAGLFLLGERLIVHSAHQFDTSLEAFRRLLFLIENMDDLIRRVKRVSRSHGEEGVELKNGQRIRFRTRTKGGGRGFTCDCLILDEAMILPEAAQAAILPTLSARPNPQVWYAGSAVDEEVHEDGIVLARLRERGIRGGDSALAYFEWSAEGDHPELVGTDVLDEPREWARANPGLGIRISTEYVSRERQAMGPRNFAVERLGIGAWPRTDGNAERVIAPETWARCADPKSTVNDPVFLVFDVRPDRSRSAIAAAGRRPDGRYHVEVIQHEPGTKWVAPRLAELVKRHDAPGVGCNGRGAATSLLPELAEHGIENVNLADAREVAQACGLFYDLTVNDMLRHLGTTELATAVNGAVKRPLGDAWAWNAKLSLVDISPLVACTLALWGFQSSTGGAPQVWSIAEAMERIRAERAARGEPVGPPAPPVPTTLPTPAAGSTFVPLDQMPPRGGLFRP